MRRQLSRILAVIGLLALCGGSYVAGTSHLFAPSHSLAADDCQSFTETGKTVCGVFLAYWKNHGGLAQQGFPISGEFSETSATDGKTYTVQYFERAVFEKHPENQPPNDVLLTLLGSEKFKTKYAGKEPAAAVAPPAPAAPAAPSAPPPTSNALPKRVVVGSLAVTLYAVRDPAPTQAGLGPKAGNRIVAFDITVENVGTSPSDYNIFNAYIKTTDDRKYDTGFSFTSLTPSLSSGTNRPGDKTRGWVVFEIPATAVIASFTYEDFDGNAAQFLTR